MKTSRFLSLSAIFAVLFFTANAYAVDFGKIAKKVTKTSADISADLKQIAKQLEKLQSDKIKVSEDERGVVLTFSAQLFAVGKADLTSEAKENLLEAAKTLREYPDANVEIEGHTDSTGSAKLNQDLSERRAKNVMDFLIELDIAKERLIAVGYGKDRPIADNGTEDGRATNRRVELIVKIEEKVEEKKEEVEEKKEEVVQKEERKIRFGARVNAGTTVSRRKIDNNSVKDGLTVGFGDFSLIPIWGIYFVPEIAMQYREPISGFRGYILKEIGIDIPLLFRFRYREENLIYLGIGPLLGFVLNSCYYKGDEAYSNKARERIDFGLAGELGFRINDNFSIDIRMLSSFASIGFYDFFGRTQGKQKAWGQGQIGVSYVF